MKKQSPSKRRYSAGNNIHLGNVLNKPPPKNPENLIEGISDYVVL